MDRIMNALRRSAVIVTIAGMAALGVGQTAGAATAAPVSPAASAQTAPVRVVTGTLYDVTFGRDGVARVQAPADDITTQASWSYKFSRETTQKLYDLAKAGAAGAIDIICQGAAPPWLDPFCHIVALAIIAFVKVAAPAGRCLKVSVTTKLGWPPIKASVGYVTC